LEYFLTFFCKFVIHKIVKNVLFMDAFIFDMI